MNDSNKLLHATAHRSDLLPRTTKMASNHDDTETKPRRGSEDESLSVPPMLKYESMGNMSEIHQDSLEELTHKLQYVNPFVAKRHEEMQHPVYMREILPTGTSCSLELTLRQLQVYVNRIANTLDHETTHEKKEITKVMHGDTPRQSSIVRNISRQSFADPLFVESSSGNVMRTSGIIPGRSNSIVDNTDASLGAIQLRIRDLRRLDFNLNPSEEPSFWVRKHAVLISIDPIRAVVMASRIIIIVPPGGMDRILDILERHLADCLGNVGETNVENGLDQDEGDKHDARHDSQFEMTAFEAILATVSSLHNQQFKALNDEAQDALSYFSSLSISKLSVVLPFVVQEKLRMAKNELSALRSRIASFKVALNSLIEEPDNMALMNLTKLGEDPSLYRLPLKPKLMAAHEEIEELLEAYLFDCNNQMTSIGNLLVKIQNAEQLMALKLDMGRNKILVTNLLLNIVSVLLVFGAYITAMFAMNLDNSVLFGGGAEGNNSVFGNVEFIWVGTMAVIIFGSMFLMWYYERAGIIPVTIHLNDFKQRTTRTFKSLLIHKQ